MPITIAGSGTITGISAGGLPDDSIIAADIAAGAVTTAKVADANITAAKLNGAQSGSAPIYAARAWINFDGTAATIGTGRASGNVSSVTDNGAGYYTVNFTTAMADANYCYVANSTRSTNNTAASTDMNNSCVCVDPTTTSIVIKAGYPVGVNTTQDSPNVTVAIFR
jgi:hypothetical protein